MRYRDQKHRAAGHTRRQRQIGRHAETDRRSDWTTWRSVLPVDAPANHRLTVINLSNLCSVYTPHDEFGKFHPSSIGHQRRTCLCLRVSLFLSLSVSLCVFFYQSEYDWRQCSIVAYHKDVSHLTNVESLKNNSAKTVRCKQIRRNDLESEKHVFVKTIADFVISSSQSEFRQRIVYLRRQF